MRTIWNGSISFGLVNIPVGLAPATKPAARPSDVSFRTLHRECGTPIKQKRWCPAHDREVGPDEIVKGWEVAKGEFVIVEDEELEAIDDQRRLALDRDHRFVDAARSTRSSSTAPTSSCPAQAPAARRPYVLLLNAMSETGMAAVGRFVQQGREKFCLIRPKGDALALETLFLAEDVDRRPRSRRRSSETAVKEPELELARQVIDSLAGEFDPSELQSQYRQDLRSLLEAKLAGEEITKPEPVPGAPVVDLMEALRRSVEERSRRRAGDSRRSRRRRRRLPPEKQQHADSSRKIEIREGEADRAKTPKGLRRGRKAALPSSAAPNAPPSKMAEADPIAQSAWRGWRGQEAAFRQARADAPRKIEIREADSDHAETLKGR